MCTLLATVVNNRFKEPTNKKNNKKNPKNAGKIVVNVNSTPRPSKGKNRSKGGKSRSALSSEDRAYHDALKDPISMRSVGARVPRPYRLATSTFHTRTKVSITPDAQGNFSFVLIGRPQQTLWVGGTTPGAVSGGLTPYTTNTSTYYAETASSLGNKVSEWRPVASGCHLHNLQPAATAIGQLFVARVPLNKKIPGPNLLATQAPTNGLLPFWVGIAPDTTGHVPLAIENLPGCKEYTIDEICGNEIILTNIPVSESAYDFCGAGSLTTLYNTNSVFDTVMSTAAGVVVPGSSDSAETTDVAGWSAVVVRGTGFPVNDPATPVMLLHIGMHIEGVPALNTSVSGGSTFVPDTLPPSGKGSSIDTLLTLASLVDSSTLVNTVVAAAQSYSRYMGGAGRVARHLLTNG